MENAYVLMVSTQETTANPKYTKIKTKQSSLNTSQNPIEKIIKLKMKNLLEIF